MALDASNFPSEGSGFNTEQLLPDVAFIINNMGSISRQIGAKPPQIKNENINNSGVTKNILKVPDNTNMFSFNKMSNTNSYQSLPTENTVLNNIDMHRFETPAPAERVLNTEPLYFKDGAGTQYKSDNGVLYVLGWQDTTLQVRIVSEKTGKVIPSEGKKFQIYGWHAINRMNDNEIVENMKTIPCVTSAERAMSYTVNEQKSNTPNVSTTNSNIAENTSNVDKNNVQETVTESENNTTVEKTDSDTSKDKLVSKKKPSGRRLI